MNSQLVEVYLDAENDVKNNNYTEAFKKYESILFDEPGNAATHNSLGWIYKTQMDNYEMAESHYLAAIKSEPDYPYAYTNYAVLLMDQERFADLEKLIARALKIATSDKSTLYWRLALAYEMQLKFEEAISCYEKAIIYCLNDEKIKNYRTDIERTEEKKQLAKKYSNWLGKLKIKNIDRTMRLLLLLLSILMVSDLSAQTTVKSRKNGTLEFVELDHGLAKVVRGTEEKQANSPTGTRGWLSDFAITKVTDSIQIIPKANFGVVYVVKAKDTVDLEVVIEWIYPETVTNEKGEKFKSIKYSTTRPTNIPSASSYSLDAPYEMVKGNWEMNIYLEKKKVYTKTFFLDFPTATM